MPKLAPQPVLTEEAYEHPVLGGGLGPVSNMVLGDAGGLTQFGAHIETLPPGSRSVFRHWHEYEDEFAYVLEGEIWLIEAGAERLGPGDAAAWPAGQGIGHCLENRSDTPARYLIIGARRAHDVIHYPDHDLTTIKDGPRRRYLRQGEIIAERNLP